MGCLQGGYGTREPATPNSRVNLPLRRRSSPLRLETSRGFHSGTPGFLFKGKSGGISRHKTLHPQYEPCSPLVHSGPGFLHPGMQEPARRCRWRLAATRRCGEQGLWQRGRSPEAGGATHSLTHTLSLPLSRSPPWSPSPLTSGCQRRQIHNPPCHQVALHLPRKRGRAPEAGGAGARRGPTFCLLARRLR